jgi:integral membrane protein
MLRAKGGKLLMLSEKLTPNKQINTNAQRMKLDSTLGQLRLLAILEGISYLLLIPTIILKYGFEMGLPNKIVGSIHGVLFVMYSLWVIYYAIKVKWSLMKTFICLTASFFPFATFIVDQKILKIESGEVSFANK